MAVSSDRVLGLTTALVAALALGIAHGSESWGGLVPCALCLWERWPYRIVAGLGFLAAIWPGKPARAAFGLTAIAMLAGTVLGAIHVGVEFHWWPSPLPQCAAPKFSGGGSIADMLARMPAAPAKPCDDPTYLLRGLPVSMAQMNLILATAFSTFAFWATIRRPRA